MLLSFDIAPEAIAEHDDWHTHEHLPERLSIPGFLRGSRWVATRGEPRYMVLYEVRELATLTSAAYLERLNNPSPWTSKMMPHYRGMRRGLCAVAGSVGFGMGNASYVFRFKPRAELKDFLPTLAARRGIGSAHLLERASAAPMTNEQRIRGADAGVDSVLLIMGYDAQALCELSQGTRGELERRGVTEVSEGLYRIDYALARGELDA